MYQSEIFCTNLKQLRFFKKLSQAAVAKELGVAQQSVDRWENGQREPNIETLWRLADFYGVTVDYLIGRVDTEFSA